MAEAAVTFLLEQVKEVLKEYVDLISGAENEFMLLSNELMFLKAIVKDVIKPEKENLFRELERRIKEVVYEVEDTIDTSLTKAIQANAKKSFRVSFRSKRFSLAIAIKSIREDTVKPMLDEAKKMYASVISDDDFGSTEDPRTTMRMDKPIRQNRVVGFDDEEATITGYLMEITENLDVISIVGIPGQGKTTLAWKIYQNEEISFHFPIRIWVNISQEFNSRDVFLQILRKFTPSQEMSRLNDNELAQTVRACLEKEKFLLVLDDIWSVDAWNKIKEVLPLSNGEGKVLITSRAHDVGVHSGVYRPPHTLKFLQMDESWMLLQYEVFGNLEDCPEVLREIGKNIAIMCDGVPLTIIVIGGILIDQLMTSPSPSKAREEWEMLLKYESEALQSDKAQRIADAVALSYHRLPHHLRECFLYLGVFPRNYEISAKTLRRLWISEGFILPESGRSLEESAEEKLNGLIYRNLLKVEKLNRMGKAKTCRVPNMIRAFCISKSRDENLFQEIKRSDIGALEPPVSEVPKFRRLCLHSDLSKFISESPRGPLVRSILCFYERHLEFEPKYISGILDGFQKLRILESRSSIKFDQFPAKLTQLIHLRYLTLYIETLKVLPEAITQLWNLQALVVETKSRSITMKANMWRMIRLRHLKTEAAIVLDDNWEGEAGHNLQTLSRLVPESCTEAVSKRAKNLRTLGVSGNLANIFESKFLETLNNLEELKMVNRVTHELTSQDMLHGLPKTNCFPPYLKNLTLTNTSLGWQHMSTLAMIKSLEALKLKENAFVGVSWRVAGYDFPSLQLLLVVGADLVVWEATPEAFPNLKFLVVKNCLDLKEIPECLGTHLKKLEIERVPRSAVESAQNIEKIHMGKPTAKYSAPFNLSIGPGCL